MCALAELQLSALEASLSLFRALSVARRHNLTKILIMKFWRRQESGISGKKSRFAREKVKATPLARLVEALRERTYAQISLSQIDHKFSSRISDNAQ